MAYEIMLELFKGLLSRFKEPGIKIFSGQAIRQRLSSGGQLVSGEHGQEIACNKH